jgi:1,4-dihydroxy-2-naphthoate octaprenyltransferase
MVGFYLQCPDLTRFPWPALVPLSLLAWASNVTTAVPDHDADARSGKRTFAVRVGDRAARKRTLLVITMAVLATPWVVGDLDRTTLLLLEAPPLAVLAANLRHLVRRAGPGRWPPFVLWNGAAMNLVMVGWIVTSFLLRPGE